MPQVQVADPNVPVEEHTGPLLDAAAPKTLNDGTITMTSAPVAPEANSEPSSDDESGTNTNEEHSVSVPQSGPPSPNDLKTKILQIIESYGVNSEQSSASQSVLTAYTATITQQIENHSPIRIILPGFPFKSPNTTDKVLGALPDFGEKLALAHLNGLGQNIAAIYEHGAEIHISSDGLVYNDLLGVSDETAWEYVEAVRRIAADDELQHIRFLRLGDLLQHPGPRNKEFYVEHAECIRRELMQRYGNEEFEEDVANKSTDDMSAFVKFVSEDLSHSAILSGLSDTSRHQKVSEIAKKIMARWKAYTTALTTNRSNYIHLSTSDPISTNNNNNNLTISLIPQPEKDATDLPPWHSTLAIDVTGKFHTVHPSDIQSTHNLIHVNGQPSHYLETSPLLNWTPDGVSVTFTHLYPTGILIRPTPGTHPSILTLPMKKIRQLSQHSSPIILRNFTGTNNEKTWVKKGSELGEVLDWKEVFGQILRVKDSGTVDPEANSVTSNEAMPMHFDGVFKFIDKIDPETGEVKKVVTPPGYQYFTCISTAPKGTGHTLFANSRLFFRYLPKPWTLERLETVKWNMKNDGFWKATQTSLPLVIRHKETGEPCVRWHQPWTDTKFSKYWVTLENEDEALIEVIDRLTYDYRVCVRFEWEAGDLLVSDNTAMLHTRSAFTENTPREMWRIHFD